MERQFKISDAHKKLAEKYKGLGYQIQFDIDGLWAWTEIEMKFVPLKETRKKDADPTQGGE